MCSEINCFVSRFKKRNSREREFNFLPFLKDDEFSFFFYSAREPKNVPLNSLIFVGGRLNQAVVVSKFNWNFALFFRFRQFVSEDDYGDFYVRSTQIGFAVVVFDLVYDGHLLAAFMHDLASSISCA